MGIYWIGVDAQEDVAQHFWFCDIELLKFLHVTDERLALVGRIVIGIALLPVTQVVCYIVIRP